MAAIKLSDEQEKILGGVMKHKGYEDRADGIQYVFQVFVSRFNAVTKYAQKDKAPPKKAAKKKVAKKAA